METLADLLTGLAPAPLTHALFVSSGSEAVEAALKLSRQYFVEKGEPERTRFIARRASYHGNTLGALGVSGHTMRRNTYGRCSPKPSSSRRVIRIVTSAKTKRLSNMENGRPRSSSAPS